MDYIDGVDFEDLDREIDEDDYDYGFIDEDPDFHKGLDEDIDGSIGDIDWDYGFNSMSNIEELY